jgi:hypothetical protein
MHATLGRGNSSQQLISISTHFSSIDRNRNGHQLGLNNEELVISIANLHVLSPLITSQWYYLHQSVCLSSSSPPFYF